MIKGEPCELSSPHSDTSKEAMTFKTAIKNFFTTWLNKPGNSEVLAELERLGQENVDLRRRNNQLSRQLGLPAQRIQLEVSQSPSRSCLHDNAL